MARVASRMARAGWPRCSMYLATANSWLEASAPRAAAPPTAAHAASNAPAEPSHTDRALRAQPGGSWKEIKVCVVVFEVTRRQIF